MIGDDPERIERAKRALAIGIAALLWLEKRLEKCDGANVVVVGVCLRAAIRELFEEGENWQEFVQGFLGNETVEGVLEEIQNASKRL